MEHAAGSGLCVYRPCDADRNSTGLAPASCGATREGAMTPHSLEIIGLNKAFGGLSVTQDVSLAMRPGERRLIFGPNGAGKTTLFNQISGYMRPPSGQIRRFGAD